MPKIDHLVYCVPDLDQAMDDFELLAGVRPVFGGYHANKGTKNALVRLGNHCYLELLAVDEENLAITGPRWMGIDLIQAPRLTRWAIHSANLAQDAAVLGRYHPEQGIVTGGQRQTAAGDVLTWQLSVPRAEPEIELIPFLIDWSNSAAHPADNLPQGCSLVEVTLYHPYPAKVAPTLELLGLEVELIEADEIAIIAALDTPQGRVIL